MPVPQGAMHGGGQPSCFDRVKMGFMMGMCVGMASGGILGGFGALRMGMRGSELIQNVGKVMVQGGQPSCFDRVKMGFMMGMCVGMASGGILGGFGALRMGMR